MMDSRSGFFLLLSLPAVFATAVIAGLSDPDKQPKFTAMIRNPLDPSFIYNISSGSIDVSVSEGIANTGLVAVDGTTPVSTPIWGYGTDELGYTWPGRTFEVQAGETLNVTWHNKIPIEPGYLITGLNYGATGEFLDRSVVDTSYHWCYSLKGYEQYSIEEHGTPIVPHLHGGHSDYQYDGNPEYFFAPDFGVKGPQWQADTYVYDNSQRAACLWYHDHALGITRLNVYAGMVGFYIIRDETDTGKVGNALNLPAFPYEVPLLIQDYMFKENGELFYPAFNGDPYYKDFITDEGAIIGDNDPTALAEFFGDHMVVNGKIWPKLDVEPRNYRFRFLNGCDSRFLVVQFLAVPAGAESLENGVPVNFTVIGGDQGFAAAPVKKTSLVIHPSARFDVIFNFKNFAGSRIIMKNMGGDEPFGGDIPGPQAFQHTDKIMAFDVSLPFDEATPDNYNDGSSISIQEVVNEKADRVRRLGLFEGRDQFGRLQPLLGTVDPATDLNGNPIYWPTTEEYIQADLVGQMIGTMTWHAPTTENIKLGDVEDWEIWNLSADAHPIHLHLVNFILVSRKEIIFDSNANEDGELENFPDALALGDGTYTIGMPLVQHDGSIGKGYRVFNPTSGGIVNDSALEEYYAETGFSVDSVVALPGQVTTIRAKFDKPGRYNWHCHILSHEDHEMMRIFHVGELPENQVGGETPLDVGSDGSRARAGLSDPDKQPKFTAMIRNPLDPSFIYNISSGSIDVSVSQGIANTGLLDVNGTTQVITPIWGYGTDELGYTWPGRTFEVQAGETLNVVWHNKIPIEPGYLITGLNNGATGEFLGRSVVDTSYHWCYSIKGYEQYSIEEHGTPIVPHLHGGHSDFFYDGNPEYFFAPNFGVKGPQWQADTYVYDNSQRAACLWYHDHALGITRLNVYAGMAGFYIIRDETDTGKVGNALNLPAFPYEMPLLIQDYMFKENGELFYPAFNGDPYYKDFITDEGAIIGDNDPTALAEFFGDHMVVNGKIWPKLDVEPRNYRFRFLNGCDSRFLVVQFLAVPAGAVSLENGVPVEFTVIGGDQGFAAAPVKKTSLVIHPSARFDVIFNFKDFVGSRIIMKNMGGDEPFGGDIPGPQAFQHTDKIMAFDVSLPFDEATPDNYNDGSSISIQEVVNEKADRVRRLGLFEGRDQFGRLQPLLGTVDPATDLNGYPIYWPTTEEYIQADLVGQMSGTMTWHAPTTENIKLGDVEEWEIWNLSADAHPIHLHLVNFILVSRKEIIFDSNANEDGEIETYPDTMPSGDGTFTTSMPLVQHDGSIGKGYRVLNPTSGEIVNDSALEEYYTEEGFPVDSIVALPGQVTTIRAKFDKPGRYNWHCHILSHEDHEMMRIFHVGELPKDQLGGDAPMDDASDGSSSTRCGIWLLVFAVAVPFIM